MKNTLALVGAFALGITVVLASSAATPVSSAAATTVVHPRDVVRIIEGTPFEVPMGRLLELKAISVTGQNSSIAALEIDGTVVANLIGGGTFSANPGVHALPEGLYVRPGEVVEVSSIIQGTTDLTVVFGCLSDL